MGFAEARLRDPAHRDVDGASWRRGRFEERVRRQWNAVPGDVVALRGDDAAALAEAIHQVVGGDRHHIEARLAELRAMDAGGDAPMADPLVRPGATD